MKITNDDIEFFTKAEDIIKRGYYPDGNKAVESYKRIFASEISEGKMKGNLSPRCGACIKESVKLTMEKINELKEKLNIDDSRTNQKD